MKDCSAFAAPGRESTLREDWGGGTEGESIWDVSQRSAESCRNPGSGNTEKVRYIGQ